MPTTSISTSPGTSTTRSLARGGTVLTAAGLLTGLSNYGTNAILARSLDTEAFGDAAVVITLMLATTGLAGVVQLVTAQRMASTGDGVSRGLGLRVGAVIALGLALASPVLADLLNTAGAAIFVLLAAGLPFQMILAVERGTLQGRLQFSGLALTFVVEGGLRLLATTTVLGFGATANAAPIGISLGLAASSMLAIRIGRRPVEPSTATNGTAAPLAATAALLMGQILLANADILIVKHSFAPAVAGGFALAALAGRAFHFLAAAITNSVFPVVAAAPNSTTAVRMVRQAAAGLGVLGLAATLGAWVFADTIVAALGAVDDPEAASLVGPYVMATTLLALAHLFAAIDVAAGSRRAAHTLVAAGTLQALTIVSTAGDARTVLDIRVLVGAALAVALGRRALKAKAVES